MGNAGIGHYPSKKSFKTRNPSERLKDSISLEVNILKYSANEFNFSINSELILKFIFNRFIAVIRPFMQKRGAFTQIKTNIISNPLVFIFFELFLCSIFVNHFYCSKLKFFESVGYSKSVLFLILGLKLNCD